MTVKYDGKWMAAVVVDRVLAGVKVKLDDDDGVVIVADEDVPSTIKGVTLDELDGSPRKRTQAKTACELESTNFWSGAASTTACNCRLLSQACLH